MRIFLRLLPPLLLFLPALPAAPRAEPPPAPPPREVRFLAWEGAPAQLLLGRGRGAPLLDLSSTQLSTAFTLKPGDNLELLRRTTNAEGQVVETVYARADWPAGLARAIAIVVPAPAAAADAPPGNLLLLGDVPENFAEHTMRFINLTPATLAVRAGSTLATLEPRAEAVAPFDPASGRLRVDFAARTDGQWQRLFGRNFPALRGYRVLALIRPPTGLEPGVTVSRPAVTLVLDRVDRPEGDYVPLPVNPDSPDA